ncbi:ester cyclase [Nocardia huaxiensis]|uniref:Ester cyclase n=1 Tax=Nocardia huaxiensis TaxID=2755382 RepID=A0A7D6Z2E7_9NOCA|nr:ester cyclase [Nocardia huaxiensis]QLY29164.1 ester cyclase [Nocardia huaxiensis]UFS97339.1 ester cyclase [Nocardia huaxiensis]
MIPTDAVNRAFWLPWLTLWNGDLDGAPRLIDDRFAVHVALLDGANARDIRGPAGLAEWISDVRAVFPDLRFTTQIGPIADDTFVVGRWHATGTYGGGFVGAQAPVGTRVAFAGVDILRIEDLRIAEQWLHVDVHDMLTQIGVHC